MVRLTALLVVLAASVASAAAPPVEPVTPSPTTAQEVAETNARRGVSIRCGKRAGVVEGVGFSTVSPDDAIRRSCFWGKRKVREIGVAQGTKGWYAVIWYE